MVVLHLTSLFHIITKPKSEKVAAITINSRSEVRAHLAAMLCNGQEISWAHLAIIGCNGLMQKGVS